MPISKKEILMYCRAQAVLILGSAGDYGVTILLVELFHRPVLLANLAGNITGAIVQFIFSRGWVFHARQGNVYLQWIRFILMWVVNFGLSAAGLYLLAKVAGWNYLLAKTLVSVLLGLTYNYIVQKWFVFR